jgi:hypothetical protein
LIWDCKGNFIAACNTKLEFVLDALSAEAHALKHGLILAETVGCHRIIISSDCSDVIKVMQDRGNSSGAARLFLMTATIFLQSSQECIMSTLFGRQMQ